MKKSLLAACATSLLFCSGAMAADVEASATASWDASATKDTTSMLVVTPLNSLTFQYAEGLNGFNSQDGAFDVTIQGQETATDFELTAQIISNTLTNASGDASTLNVGVAWNGTALTNSSDTVLVNSSSTSGLESLMVDGAFNGAARVSDQSNFKFTIASATSDGSQAVTDYSALPDGYWTGDVKVQFNATWTTPSA